jgi:hypothetical protein
MGNYSESALKALVCNQYNNDNNSMQILLINDKEAVKRLTDYFNGLPTPINAIGITSQNRDSGSEEERVFKELTKNNPIDYNVLIATSWIDVGINFVNENVTDIYCLLDNEYVLGDCTLIWQIMARARNCNPVLYITKPQLSFRQKSLISFAGQALNADTDDIKSQLIKNMHTDQENEAYKCIFDICCQSAKSGIEGYEKGAVEKDVIDYINGIYFEAENKRIALFSEIPIRYFLHRTIEKLDFNFENISRQTNCKTIKNCILAEGDFVLCTNDEIENVEKYLISLVYSKAVFTQDELKDELTRITDDKLKIGQLKTFIKNSRINLILVNHKRSRDVRYYRLFFDMNIEEVREYASIFNISLEEIGYAKCSTEELCAIRKFKPDVEVIKDLVSQNDEYFVDISHLGKFDSEDCQPACHNMM